ncbi:membrane-bound lytic murein transglycosylase D [Pseudomonas duriflava]|uniref:Membrane-bound lytic murein transglycosylase D n=1 Tax=Pseudomonas duriflava TaxID=459528 RepID=A0A562Q8Z3_9PSED|nr:lytic transglycosylase domain-containing protein [Pseudomonas duriflava]TWI53164.1 membrane-bound lytic murein transglycosylase D [Pseudomonas duriflava]
MPPQPQKNVDLDGLARTAKLSALCLAIFLAGCQGMAPKEQERYLPEDSLSSSINMKREPEWLKLAPQKHTPNDVWERVRSGYQLQNEIGVNPRIEQQRLWYASNPASVEQSCNRGGLYLHYIVERLEERNMPLELALLPVVESSFDPFALSHSAAAGIWQFIPTTGRYFNLRQTRWYDGRLDITASTNAALDYLSKLHNMFNGDWLLALAAYNAGEGTVSRAIERNQKLGLPTDYWNLSSLPQETQAYVPKLLALSQLVLNPDSYGIQLDPIANEPYFEVVKIKQHLDLAKVAQLAELDEDELYRLNPAYTRRVTMDGPKQLLIPAEKAELFEENLAQKAADAVVHWQEYQVRRGDTLGSIANRYQISTAQIQSFNKLQSTRLGIGQRLMLPRVAGIAPLAPKENVTALIEEPITRTYRVKSGDNLWTIARENHVELNDLKRWNALDKRSLKVGQVLKLYGTPVQKQKASKTAASQTPRQNATYYRVKRGDSLYMIAKRFNVQLQNIQQWNPSSSKALTPGQTLTLYLD